MTNKAPFCAFLWLTLSFLSRQIRSLPNYQVSLWSLPTYQVGPQNLCNLQLINDLRLRNITYEIINLFLQNEPNFRKSQVNVTAFITMNYAQMDTWSIRKNEPKTNPNEPNFKPNFPTPNSQIYPISHQRTMNKEQRTNNKQTQCSPAISVAGQTLPCKNGPSQVEIR